MHIIEKYARGIILMKLWSNPAHAWFPERNVRTNRDFTFGRGMKQ